MCIRDRYPTDWLTMTVRWSRPVVNHPVDAGVTGRTHDQPEHLMVPAHRDRTGAGAGGPGPQCRTQPGRQRRQARTGPPPVSYTHLRAHETPEHLVCRLLLEKKKKKKK